MAIFSLLEVLFFLNRMKIIFLDNFQFLLAIILAGIQICKPIYLSNVSIITKLEIVGGKVLKGAATTPSGHPADSIVFYIRFYDDSYGFTYTKVSGFRRTGFGADDF